MHKESEAKSYNAITTACRTLLWCFSGWRSASKAEESLIGSFRLGLIPDKACTSTELQVSQRAYGIQPHDAAMIENLLKFGRGFRRPARGNQSLAAHIG